MMTTSTPPDVRRVASSTSSIRIALPIDAVDRQHGDLVGQAARSERRYSRR